MPNNVNNDKVTPKIGSLHYIWHFEMLTPINLGSHFFHFFGGIAPGCSDIKAFLLIDQREAQSVLAIRDCCEPRETAFFQAIPPQSWCCPF